MEGPSDFPLLSEPLDSYSLKDSFIAAYPNFLVIGKVLINNQDIVFLENSYFKIPTYYFQDFFEALTDIGKFLIHDKQPETNSTTVFETETYLLNWTIQENNVLLKIDNHSLNKTTLEVDLVQFFYLVTGFKELFFKPFCLKYFVNYSFYCLSEVKTKNDIEKLSSISEAVQTTIALQLNFKQEELFVISENIMRYKSEIMLYVTLKNIIPTKPF
jgi:hypothetical protein